VSKTCKFDENWRLFSRLKVFSNFLPIALRCSHKSQLILASPACAYTHHSTFCLNQRSVLNRFIILARFLSSVCLPANERQHLVKSPNSLGVASTTVPSLYTRNA